MKIAICASMVFSERMLAVKKQLEDLGHTVYISGFASKYIGKTTKQKEKLTIYHKKHKGAIREFWEKIKKSDNVLILNYDRHGIKNYIGGNTLMEIGFAYVLNKRIFLLNPIPKIPYYESEIAAVKPIILKGNIENLLRILDTQNVAKDIEVSRKQIKKGQFIPLSKLK